MNSRNHIVTRFALLYLLMLSLGVAILVKVFAVQTIKTDRWEQIADNLTNYTVSLDPNRGNICADDGNVLATSVPGYYIRIDLAAPGVRKIYNAQSDSLAIKLASFFRHLPASEVKQRMDAAYRQKDRGYLLTPRKIDYNELQVIKKFPVLRRGAFGGGRIIEQENKRVLPLGKLASRTVGTLNKGAADQGTTIAGNTGIEQAFEEYLRGKSGVGYRQNLSGRWVNRIEIEPRDGMDIMTNLNVRYQDITESALERQLIASHAEWGTAILMEVKTGKIKAMANLGRKSPGYYDEIYNYALGDAGCYEPGSTFKLMSLMVALEHGLVDTSQVFDTGNGSWKYRDRTIYDSDFGKGTHGPMSVKQIFEKSSNVGVAKIITSCYDKDPQKFVDAIHDMGVTDPIDTELTGEGIPFFKYPGDKDWWGTTLAWMSYGYESKMTPLQILTFYNAVANDGKMVKPWIVREIQDKGDVVERMGPKTLKHAVASRSTIKKAQKMLEGVCDHGTGKSIQSDIVRIAGKTGTAQISSGGGYGKGLYLASFVGYFPAEEPVYSMIVTVNRPQGAYYGGAVAGPVFREVAEKVFAIHQKFNTLEEEEEEDAPEPLPDIKNGNTRDVVAVMRSLDVDFKGRKPRTPLAGIEKDTEGIALKEIQIRENQVPDVRGMGARDAVFLLEKSGLQVRISGIGKVKSQSLLPGYKHKKGQTITLTMG